MNNETPLAWLLSELEARGLSDLIEEYHSRRREYTKRLNISNKERKAEQDRLLLEEARMRRESESKS